MNTAAIIPASGTGTRFGGDVPKQFVKIGGRSILQHTIGAFEACEFISHILVTVPPGHVEQVRGYGIKKAHAILVGGSSRAESVYLALHSLPGEAEVVLIHDGVRPNVDPNVIRDVAETAREHGAAIACTKVFDTVKRSAEGKIIATVDRSDLWLAQTPQGFRVSLILEAFEKAAQDGVLAQITDDSQLVERLGTRPKIIPQSSHNIKITTEEDLLLCKFLLKV